MKMSEGPGCQMTPEAQALTDEVMNLQNYGAVYITLA